MKNKKYFRYDVACSVLIPFLSGILWIYLSNRTAWNSHIVFYTAVTFTLFGLLLEFPSFFDEGERKGAKDNGVISGLIGSLSILGLAANTYYDGVLLFSKDVWFISLCIGSPLFIGGAFLRYLAKRELGKHFSHSVRIMENHSLQTRGIYRYIRHPAYCGSTLIIIGVSIMFGSWMGGLIIIITAPLCIKRMENEEKLLLQNFGKEFECYMKNTKRIIPFIY